VRRVTPRMASLSSLLIVLRKPPWRFGSSPRHNHAAADLGPACRLLGCEGCRGAAGIALGLGQEEATFEAAAAGGTTGASSYWTARVIFYPPLPQVRPAAPPRGAPLACPVGGVIGLGRRCASTVRHKGSTPSASTPHQSISCTGGAHGLCACGQAAAPELADRAAPAGEGAARAARGGEVARSVQLSCGEHTDYGLLTLVNQEPGVSALQVRVCRCTDVPHIYLRSAALSICNI